MAFGSEESALSIVVRLKDEASRELDKFRGKVEKMQPAFRKMAAAGVTAFAGITAVAAKSVTAYAEVERAQRQLEHAIIGVSKGTSAQVEEVNKLTAALQKKAGIDADSLNMGVAQLSTFGLQTQSVINLTKSLADFTVNQNGLNASADQYIDSANTIAKALNGQFGILEKSGIRFTELQQTMILTGTEAQKVAALQEGLAQNLRETTDTVAGVDLAMAKFSRTTEDIVENLGKALVPAFARLAETVQPIVEKFAEWAEKNPELLSKIIMVAGGVALLVAGLGILGMVLPAVITGIGLLLSPVGLVAAAIAVGLVPAIKYARDHFGELKDKAESLWETLKSIDVIDRAREAFNFLKESVTALWVAFKDSIIVDALRFAFEQLHAAFVNSLLPALKNLWDLFQTLRPILEPLAKIILGVLVVAFTAFVTVASVVIRILAQLIQIVTSVALAIAKVLTPPIKAVVDFFKDIVEWVQKAIDKLNLFDKAKSLVNSVSKVLTDRASKGVSTVKKLAGFETGGTVPGPVGMAVPIIAHGQETILPARKSASGGGTVISLTINNPTVRNDTDLYAMKSQLDATLRGLIRDNKLSIAA